MFDGLTESWFISKVETVIQTEINNLPVLITARSDGVAHAVVMHQYRTDSFPFSKTDGKRLNPNVVAVQAILTFVNTYRRQGQIIVNGEDCLGLLKILCLNFLQRLEATEIGMRELTFIEMFSRPLFRKVFPELCTE
ncbi:MAG: hypothetical protein E5X94_00370 [Mesorhizobium sp.]|uniref:hypothetical protein n=1 Tax=unclassified Enterobacter TaxID=2608935 RepID=UPI00120F79B9|nr:hypothetical protein [Enterobacter sp. 296B2]TIM54929.1 MAG: hypothetical protein E5Y48_02875 [Mesorhizobium sp.]TIN88433.1 MAG: hypothetical protein E5X94_00370 [Mesorhizobium sp.]